MNLISLLSIRLTFLALLLGLTLPIKTFAEFETVSVSVPPWVTNKINRLWAKHFNQFGYEQKIRVRLESPSDYSEFINNAIQGRTDIVVTPAYIAAYLWKHHNYEIAVSGLYETDVLILSLKSSDIKTLADMNNKHVGMPDPLAQASLRIQLLSRKHNHHYQTTYFGQHDTVLSKLLNHEIDIGVIAERVLIYLSESQRSLLRRIHTEKAPGGAFVLTSSKLDKSVKRKIIKTLLAANKNQADFMPVWEPVDQGKGQYLYNWDKPVIEEMQKRLDRILRTHSVH